jgi:hypothetical protein
VSDERSGLGAERRAGLRQAKLAAVIQSRWAATNVVPPSGVGAPGPALVDLSAAAARRGWVLIDLGVAGAFGGACTWGLRHGLDELHVIVDEGPAPSIGSPTPSVLARRAGLFRNPTRVWEVTGRQLRPVTAPGQADPPGEPSGCLVGVEGYAELMRAHGVDPLVEHGVLVGEVLGLEVARVLTDDGEPRLAVGVGHHDREARAEMRAGQSLGAALDEVAAVVRRWRAPGAERHPANMLARERWLRSLVMGRPDLVGARWLDPVASLLPRGDLRRAVPAVAVGEAADGAGITVACSTGVDLDLVPVAADHRRAAGVSPRLVIVVPQGDDVAATRDLAAVLVDPAELVTVPRNWPAALSG